MAFLEVKTNMEETMRIKAMEVYLYECEEYEEIYLKIPDFDLLFGRDDPDCINLVPMNFTPLFWNEIKSGKAKLTKIGEF